MEEGREARPAAGSAGATALALVRALEGLSRALRIYPPGHGRVLGQVEELVRLGEAPIAAGGKPLLLSVHWTGIKVSGTPLLGEVETTAGFAFLLRRLRIRSLRFGKGMTGEEYLALADLLGSDPHTVHASGGPEFFLSAAQHPHLELTVARGGPATDEVFASIEQALAEPSNEARLDRIRSLLGAQSEEETEAEAHRIDRLLWEVFSRPEWSGLSKPDLRRAVHAFLELLETSVRNEFSQGTGSETATEREARMKSVLSFFEGLAPSALMGTPDPQDVLEDDDTIPMSYEVGDAVAAAAAQRWVARAAHRLTVEIESYGHLEGSLLVLCELVFAARNLAEYEARRDLLFQAFDDTRFPTEVKARVILRIALDIAETRFESREKLFDQLWDRIRDEETLSLALATLLDRPEVARALAGRLVARPDSLQILATLLCNPLLEPLHPVIADFFLETARARSESLCNWARHSGRLFLRPEVFNLLFERDLALLGPVCKEILTTAPKPDRLRLIDRLVREGTSRALRLLVLGISYDEEPCDPDLVRRLGEFEHPLALQVLKEIVHRSNTKGVRWHEVASAMNALHETRLDEASAFLQEVVRKRTGPFRFYRHELRVLAARVLATGSCDDRS
ncbi:MAG: hypothetical protein ACT4PV_08975 [Planctomycetaceae bacterium]